MNFQARDELQEIRDLVRTFATRELAPVIPECEETETFPRHLLPRMGELGLLAVGAPEEHGGLPGGLSGQAIVLEELARISAGISSAISVTGCLVPRIIFELGTPEQIETYAKPLIRGEKVGAFGLTEPDAGSDVSGIKTRAVRDGDAYVLNGSKIFTSNAPIADFVLTVAYTEPGKGVDGMSIFLIDVGTPGFEVAPKYRKESIRTCETSGVFMNDCRVPASNLLGGEGTGFRRIMKGLNADRMYNCARSLGIAQAAFEAADSYARQREQFGRPIASFQTIAFKLVDMAVKIDAARLLIERAGWLYDQGLPYIREISMAKLYTSEICGEVARDSVQIHGGAGILRETQVARYMRDALLSTIGAGSSEIQRRILARRMGIKVD